MRCWIPGCGTVEEVRGEARQALGFRLRLGRRWRGRGALLAGAALTGLVALGSLLAPVLAPHRPTQIFPGHELQPPSQGFWLGTDELGRDVLSRLLHGGRSSLAVTVPAVLLAAVVGVAQGLLAGYLGGPVDGVLTRVLEVLLAFPSLLVALATVAIVGPTFWGLVLALGLPSLPHFAMVVRAAVMTVKHEDYVQAAVALGAPWTRVVARHLLPQVLTPVIIQAALGLSLALLVEASLSFLGLGVQPPAPNWGAMLSRGHEYMTLAPWLVLGPAGAIMVAILGFNLLGEGLRDALDPSRRSVHRGSQGA